MSILGLGFCKIHYPPKNGTYINPSWFCPLLPVGESSRPSVIRSLHRSLQVPFGLKAVWWVTSLLGCSKMHTQAPGRSNSEVYLNISSSSFTPAESNLFSGCDAQSVRVHRSAVMEQHSGHRLAVLLQAEGFVPVAPTLVVFVPWPVEHGEHDGHIQGVIVLVLYIPHKYRHG